MKLSEDFNGADLRNVCTEAGKMSFIGKDIRKHRLSRYLILPSLLV